MRISSSARSADDELVNLGLIGLAAAVGLSALFRGAGSIAAWISGVDQPGGSLGSGLSVVVHPDRPSAVLDCPGLSPWVYWLVVSTLLVGGFAAVWHYL